jgi:N-dimethylarginine dimethylaminohydrolase
MGFGPRSHREAAYVVSESFGAECVALELSDPSFYHLDTAFCPLPSGDVIYYPGAFSESGLRAIEERVAPGHRVAIDHEDATRFAANAVPLNSTIILSSCSERLRRRLVRIRCDCHPAACLLAQRRLGLLPDAQA